MTVEKQVYFDSFDNLTNVKLLENVMIQTGVPANALHIYADDSVAKDNDWPVDRSGISGADSLIDFKNEDNKSVIVGIDECHQDKFPRLRSNLEEAIKEYEAEQEKKAMYAKYSGPLYKSSELDLD